MLSSLFLPLIIVIPLLSLLALFLLGEDRSHDVVKASAVLVFIAALAAVFQGSSSFNLPYLASVGISLPLVVNSFNSILLIMAAIVYLAASLVGDYFIKRNRKMYGLFFLLAEASSLGVFLSYNLFMFYLFL